MNIAIPVYENRVMPRFGCTRQMILARINDEQIVEHKSIALTADLFRELPLMLAAEQVSVIICGGIHPRFQAMLRQQQIDVVWGVRGDWHDVVDAYISGELHAQPQQCQWQHGQRHGFHGHRRHGERNCPSDLQRPKEE